jgi:hypothetical protein
VPIPLAERARPEHAPALRAIRDRLWALLKHEALGADREVQAV